MKLKHFQYVLLLGLLIIAQPITASTLAADTADCLCEFGIQYMSVRYNGPSGVDIEVYATKNQQDFVQVFHDVDSGSQLFIDKSEFLKGSVKTKTYLMVTGEAASEVSYHTSCSEDILNQTKGYFTVTAYQDAFGNSCSLPLALLESVSPISCFDGSDGAIKLDASGGFPPYTWQWNDEASTAYRTGLSAGTHQIMVRDALGQEETATFVLQDPDPLLLESVVSNTTCGEDNGGSIQVLPEGGTAPYRYLWSTGDTTETISGFSEGAYIVEVTDASKCMATDTFYIEKTGSFEVSIAENECQDGTLNLEISGGTSPYFYKWSNGSTAEQLLVDSAGVYAVTITDANGCESRDTIQVADLNQLEVSASFDTPGCSGDSLGSIYTAVDGDRGPFSFLWNTGDTIQHLENVLPGSYDLTITDQRGTACAETFTFSLPEAPKPTIHATVEQIRCAGESDGTITIDSIDGHGPFEFVWENGDSTTIRSELGADAYTLTVTDSLGCSTTETFSILEPDTLQVSLSLDFCISETIRAMVSGGTSPYTYTWNGEPGSGSMVPETAGTYQVVVADSRGCMDSASIDVPKPFDPLNISGNITHISCEQPEGSIELNISGGTVPYTYTWDSGDTTSALTGLDPGYYQVTVTDKNGCEKSRLFSIREQSGLTLTASITEPDCDGNGMISVSAAGGQAPYTYYWSTGDSTASIADLEANDYQVTVSDNGGCEITEIFTLVWPDGCEDTGDGDEDDGDSEGGVDDDLPADSTEVSNCCDGKVTWLTLQYLGDETTEINVYQERGNMLIYSGMIAPNEEFTFYGHDNKQTLGPEVMIQAGWDDVTRFHTSCSEPIGPGLISGNFKVIAGESRNGGKLCPVDSETTETTTLTYDVYPNPSTKEHFKLRITNQPSGSSLEVRIFDLSGLLRSAKIYPARQRVYELNAQAEGLTPGQYILYVSEGGKTASRTVIIQ